MYGNMYCNNNGSQAKAAYWQQQQQQFYGPGPGSQHPYEVTSYSHESEVHIDQYRPFLLQMMHQVPSCSPVPPTHDAHSFDFDLDLLPSSETAAAINHSLDLLSDVQLPLTDTSYNSDIDSCGGSVCGSSVFSGMPNRNGTIDSRIRPSTGGCCQT